MPTSLTESAISDVPVESEIVRVENVSAGYPGKTVWRGANFSLDRGEFVAVIGPNGAGKTTLFRLLLGLQHPLSGKISILGASPKRGSPRIGYVPQHHLIDSETNVEALELVKLAYSGNRWGFRDSQNERQAALKALGSVGAANLAHQSLGSMSGGELQRVFLAEALVSNPEILLLDEPLSHLDLRRGTEFVQLVRGIVESSKVTALMVSHDINPVLRILDKIIYVARGKIATGKPEEILTSERLSGLYGVPVEVIHDSRGNVAIIGVEEHLDHIHHEHHLDHYHDEEEK
jgi:zinc/manganese transport system ATP-binding protein